MNIIGTRSQASAAGRCVVSGWAPVAGTRRRRSLSAAPGFALPSAMMLLALLLTLGASTMLFTLLDVKSTQHFSTGNQAFAATEAGIIDALNNIQTRGVVNFQRDVVDSGLVPTTLTAIAGYPNVTYQLAVAASVAAPAREGSLAATGRAPLNAERVTRVGLRRGPFTGGPGALHLSSESAQGAFAGNSMTIDGNNWTVTNIDTNPPASFLNPIIPPKPAISTRNDLVTSQVITALAGQGTITGIGDPPSVYTTGAASTADLLRFAQAILAANGAPNGCNTGNQANQNFWLPGPCSGGPPGSQCGVHCVRRTNGNAKNQPDFMGTLAAPQVTYVDKENLAKINAGSSGAGILIFAGNVEFGGNFTYCGWVLFLNPSADGITILGTPEIYGQVLTPLPQFKGGGSIMIRYSHDCLAMADTAGINPDGNLPHPLVITSWAEM